MQSGATQLWSTLWLSKFVMSKSKEIRLDNIHILVLVVVIYSGIYCDMIPNIYPEWKPGELLLP